MYVKQYLLLPLLCTCVAVYGQHAGGSAVDSGASNMYERAISEYFKAFYKKGVSTPDTVFIGKNVDMPSIRLPTSIEHIPVKLTSSEAAQKKLKYRTTLVYLNVVGWIEDNNPEFMVVHFENFRPQHNCQLYFIREKGTASLRLLNVLFKYPYGK